METASGSSCPGTGAALDSGRSTVTPVVIIGAVTMKMTSSTSMTSTIGVTLISQKGRACAWRFLLWPLPSLIAIGLALQLARENRVELGGKIVELVGKARQ